MASSRAPATHCAHRWAHNEDPGKTGKTRNVRFVGMSLYHHATVIAVKYPKQSTVVVAGDGIWNSSTTRCEKSRAVNALPPGWNVIYVDCDTYGHDLESLPGLRRCHDAMKKRLKRLAAQVAAARSGASQSLAWTRWSVLRRRCDDLAEMLRRKAVDTLDYFSAEEGVAIAASVRRHREQTAERDARYGARMAERYRKEQERMAELAKTETEDAEQWRRHEYRGPRTYWAGTYVRLSRDGGSVETSKGVVVPIADALSLYRMCGVAKARGKGFEPGIEAAIAVGGYRVVAVEATGNARVGCHYLTYDEMERCFKDAEQRKLVQAEEIEMEVRA